MIQELIWIGAAMVASTATYWTHTRFGTNPVMASALVTLSFALPVALFDFSSDWVRAIPYAAIGGSFIGMSTKKCAKGFSSILLASVIFGIIFSRSSDFFEGFGGALGTSACISVLTAISWRKLIKRSKIKSRKIYSRLQRPSSNA